MQRFLRLHAQHAQHAQHVQQLQYPQNTNKPIAPTRIAVPPTMVGTKIGTRFWDSDVIVWKLAEGVTEAVGVMEAVAHVV